jgi:hypothetical protein
MQKSKGFWTVLKPSAWPTLPDWMSFSTINAIEACPRQWALLNADYADVWQGKGYPTIITIPALEGIAIHRSIKTVLNALVYDVSDDVCEERIVGVLTQLGGFSAILAGVIDEVMSKREGNPRNSPVNESTRLYLMTKIPEMRIKLQKAINHITPLYTRANADFDLSYSSNQHKTELKVGTYSELLVEAQDLHWRGVLDMLVLTEAFCEIREYKTGVYQQNHETQLQIYALLWLKDQKRNPSARPADRLTLVYPDKVKSIPVLDFDKMMVLASNLEERRSRLRTIMNTIPPKATPSFEICSICQVRHLCEEYWPWLAQHNETDIATELSYQDFQVQLLSPRGDSCWLCKVEYGCCCFIGTHILLDAERSKVTLGAGMRLRLLNVQVSASPCMEPRISTNQNCSATVTQYSELFVMHE